MLKQLMLEPRTVHRMDLRVLKDFIIRIWWFILQTENGVDFEALAEALNREGYWSDVVGCQKVDFSRRFAVVFKNSQTRDRLVENGINVNGIHVNFGITVKRRTPRSERIFLSYLLVSSWDKFTKFLKRGIVRNIIRIERIIQGRKIDTGDRVIIFTRIAINIPSYVYVRGWRAFINYRGQQKTCRVCSGTDHLAKECPKARGQQNPKQPEAQPQGEPQDQSSSSPSHSNTQSKPSQISQEEIMDTQNTNDSVQENLNITEPDPKLLRSRLDDVFGGPVSPDPEDDAESISSIEDYQDVSSETKASEAWADAKIEAEVQA